MEGELRGTPDHFEGFIRIRDAGEFDDDAFLSGALQGWLGDPELIDAPTQVLEGSGHGVDTDSLGLRFLSLENDLRAALEVQSESNGWVTTRAAAAPMTARTTSARLRR